MQVWNMTNHIFALLAIFLARSPNQGHKREAPRLEEERGLTHSCWLPLSSLSASCSHEIPNPLFSLWQWGLIPHSWRQNQTAASPSLMELASSHPFYSHQGPAWASHSELWVLAPWGLCSKLRDTSTNQEMFLPQKSEFHPHGVTGKRNSIPCEGNSTLTGK